MNLIYTSIAQTRLFVHYFWDEPYLYKYCPDQIIRRCIPAEEQESVLTFAHQHACDGHFGGNEQQLKYYKVGYIGLLFLKTLMFGARLVLDVNVWEISPRWNVMPQQSILVVELFDVWGIDFMGPFPSSNGN